MPGSPYQSLVQTVRQYLREGNAPAAFTALQAAQPPLPGEIDDRLVILTGRWNSSQQAYQLGTLTAEQAQAVAAQVQLSILDLLTSLEEMSEEEAGQVAGESPYMGLRFFDTADARLFFGRDELTSQLASRLKEERLLAVVGASGSGKSSLVRAGVVPAWMNGIQLPNGDTLSGPVHVFTPGTRPLESLAESLTRNSESVSALATLMDDLARDTRSLHFYLRRLTGAEKTQHLLLVVDQFEETFTLCKDPAERRAFIEALLYATAEEQAGRLRMVLTLRADFYPHCAEYEGLRLALAQHQAYIGAMSPKELRLAIEAPALAGGWDFQPGLVAHILQDVGIEPGALPLLSHALLETWRRRQGRTLTLAGYTAAGGVRQAIAHTAERIYQRLNPTEQALTRSIFLRLTELGEGSQDTRRRAMLDELVPANENRDTVTAVLETLIAARLVITAQDVVEVAHEALVREWPMLRGWLETDREGLRTHRHLSAARQEWQRRERDPDELYRGARLAQAREWAAAHPNELNAQEQEFLSASVEEELREEKEREAQRQRELAQAKALAEEQRKRRIDAEYRQLQAQWAELRASAEHNFARAERNRLRALREHLIHPDNVTYIATLTSRAEEFESLANSIWADAGNFEKKLRSLQIEDGVEQRTAVEPDAVFSLEVFPGRDGSAYLVHYGSESKRQFLILDGGSANQYIQQLKPHFEELQLQRKSDHPLPIELAIISHYDMDHIGGMLKLLEDIKERRSSGQAELVAIKALWFNHFFQSLISGERKLPPKAVIPLLAKELGIGLNEPFDYAVMPSKEGPARVTLNGGLSATVVAPDAKWLEDWYVQAKGHSARLGLEYKQDVSASSDFPLEEIDLAVSALAESFSSPKIDLLRSPAEITGIPSPRTPDQSLNNLASVVTLLEFQGKRMLFCGDGRCDQIVEGLAKAGLLPNGEHLHLDLMVVPHFGSPHSVSEAFFELIFADHYLIIPGIKFRLPRLETIQMIAKARGGASYTIHLPGSASLPWLADEKIETEKAHILRETDRFSIHLLASS